MSDLGPFLSQQKADAARLADVTVSPVFETNSFAIRMSREMAITLGHIEPTPEERAAIDERHRVFVIERNKRALILEAARVWLDRIDEPAARAVLDLHKPTDEYGRDVCAECLDGDDHSDWPCATVEAIAKACGIEMPEW